MKDGESVVHTVGTITIITDGASAKFLDGLVIDYSEALINGGLQFTNADTKSTCGCGQSFNLSGFPKVEGGKCKI
jgi:iron-sulfur cluster assembly protein